MRSLRSIVTALLLLAGLTLGLLPAAAQAAGPGVTLFTNTQPLPIEIPGGRFSGGVSISGLLQQNNIDPANVTFVNVTRGDGGVITLKGRDFAAVIIDDGRRTRFVRGGSAKVTATAATGPLQVSVNAGDISVIASVNRDRVDAGERVSFSARVRFRPSGAQLSYEWDFGDGNVRSGLSVTHVYADGGNYQARITVSGVGGSDARCENSCSGTDDVDVTVGDPPSQPTAPPSPGGGTGDPNVPGSSAGTGGGGQGGSGGTGSGTGSDPAAAATPSAGAKPKPKPKPKKPFGVTISGVLLDEPGTEVSKLPSGTAAGAPKGPRQTGGGAGEPGIELPLSGALAMAFIMIGALRERRGVRLRLA